MDELWGRNRVKAHIPEHGGFCATFSPEGEAAARKMAEAWGLVVKPFGVRLITVYPSPMTWEQKPGWSTWDVRDSTVDAFSEDE